MKLSSKFVTVMIALAGSLSGLRQPGFKRLSLDEHDKKRRLSIFDVPCQVRSIRMGSRRPLHRLSRMEPPPHRALGAGY